MRKFERMCTIDVHTDVHGMAITIKDSSVKYCTELSVGKFVIEAKTDRLSTATVRFSSPVAEVYFAERGAVSILSVVDRSLWTVLQWPDRRAYANLTVKYQRS